MRDVIYFILPSYIILTLVIHKSFILVIILFNIPGNSREDKIELLDMLEIDNVKNGEGIEIKYPDTLSKMPGISDLSFNHYRQLI